VKDVKETLEITNFLSIKHIKWKIADFNILAGEMAAGKSLCLKLLKFFEDIIPELLSSSYNSFCNSLKIENLYSNLTDKFTDIFHFFRSDNNEPPQYNIIYTFVSDNENFNMTISGSNKTDIIIKCEYLEELLKKWGQKFDNDIYLQPKSVSPERFLEVKRTFYYEMLKEFNYRFPVRTIFIPASRTTLLFSSNYSDKYLSDYSFFLRFLPKYRSSGLAIDKILKADIKNNGSSYFLDSKDGRRVPLEMGSSGQQEIATILLLLDKLGNFRYNYGIERSIIIEELSAHIFPSDQKETIELIVNVYRTLKDSGTHTVRFFMTIHSPIILDCLNNMLKKGMLLKEYEGREAEINKLTKIPALYPLEVSANFINRNGSMQNIFNQKKKQIEAKKITTSINEIKDDAQILSKFKDRQEF